MPSVETQTTWSWIQDLSTLTKLRNERTELELSLRDLDQDLPTGERSTSPGQESNATQDTNDQLFRSFGFMTVNSAVVAENPLKPLQSDNKVELTITEPEQTNGLCLPKPEQGKELCLPKITSPTTQSQKDSEHKADDVKLLPLVASSTFELSDPDTPDEEDIEQTYTDLFNLPWPKILQYMRESESYASRYFSLQNKPSLARRLKASKNTIATTTGKKTRLASECQDYSNTDSDSSEESELEPSEVEGVNAQKADTKELLQTCDFCGEDKPKYSLLSTRTAPKESKADIHFCCEENRKFSVLVATCLRQLVDKLQNGPPKKITVKLSKKQIKKTAEQRAFALMCRKRKWEQLLQKKMSKEQTPGRVYKQARIIQFSLLSTETLDTGWMVRPQSKTKHCTSRKRKILNKTHKKKKVNVLTPGLLKRLQHDQKDDAELDQRLYGDNTTSFVTLLPNKTGQSYYRSGNIAMVVFSPYAGVLAYLLYEDSTKGLLGYLDELGRIGCYYADGNIQLYSGQTGGVLFEPDGTVRRKWNWDTPNNNSFQPTTITLNKHIAVKCQSRGHSTISFSSEHKVIKFSVDCVLQKDEKLGIVVDPSYTNWLADQLQQSKKQISGLLQGMQTLSRSRKLAQLKSVYDPLGRENPQQGTRQRTKSTGSIATTYKQSALKHKIN